MNMTVDTLQISRALTQADFTEKQAEALAEIVRDQEERVVTNASLDAKLEKVELRMKLYNGAMATATVGILSAFNFFA